MSDTAPIEPAPPVVEPPAPVVEPVAPIVIPEHPLASVAAYQAAVVAQAQEWTSTSS